MARRKGEAYIGGHTILHGSRNSPPIPHPSLPTPDLPGGEMRPDDFRQKIIDGLKALKHRTPKQEKMLKYYLAKEAKRLSSGRRDGLASASRQESSRPKESAQPTS